MGKEIKQREKSHGCRVRQRRYPITDYVLPMCEIELELAQVVDKLKKHWHPEKEVTTFFGYHGSQKGEEIKITLYYNELTGAFADKEEAFAGFVMKKIKGLLNENTLSDEQKQI